MGDSFFNHENHALRASSDHVVMEKELAIPSSKTPYLNIYRIILDIPSVPDGRLTKILEKQLSSRSLLCCGLISTCKQTRTSSGWSIPHLWKYERRAPARHDIRITLTTKKK